MNAPATNPGRRPASLITLLTLPLCAALLLVGLVGLGFAEYLVRQRLTADFDAGLRARLDFLTAITWFEDADPEEGHEQPWVEFEFDAEGAPEFLAGPAAAYFQLWQSDAELARSDSLGAGEALFPQPLNQQLLPLGEPQFLDAPLPDGRPGRHARMRFLPQFDDDWADLAADRAERFARRYPGQARPQAVIDVAIARGELDRTLTDVRLLLAGALAAMLLVLVLLVPPIARWSLRSLHQLNRRLGEINADQLQVRVPGEGLPAELRPVAGAVNGLLEKLQQAFDKERLFSRNVAHELRTPIAELRSLSEVGGQWPDDAQANARFYADARAIAGRMERAVNNLLMMARQESGQLPLLWERIDLVHELRLLLERHDAAGIELRAPEQLWVQADRACLEIIVGNLVVNALSHGNGSGERYLRLTAAKQTAELCIANPAPSLQAEDLPHLFDRFWRKDQARSSGAHVGLGLSLVHALVTQLGWRIELALSEENEFSVCVSGIRVAAD